MLADDPRAHRPRGKALGSTVVVQHPSVFPRPSVRIQFQTSFRGMEGRAAGGLLMWTSVLNPRLPNYYTVDEFGVTVIQQDDQSASVTIGNQGFLLNVGEPPETAEPRRGLTAWVSIRRHEDTTRDTTRLELVITTDPRVTINPVSRERKIRRRPLGRHPDRQ